MNFSIKKTIILGVIVINLLGAWALYYMFYGKENSFDYSKRAVIISSKIRKIETDLGTWKLNDSIFDFYKDYKVEVENRNDIESFCRIIQNSKPKYIESRAQYFIDIYLNKVDMEPQIRLLRTMSNEVYFEYEDHTYEGKELAEFMEKNKTKQ